MRRRCRPTRFLFQHSADAKLLGCSGASTPVSVLDLEAAAVPNDPYANLKQDFAIAKALVAATAVSQGASDGGTLAVAEAYHTMLVAPLCFAATKSFFTGR